jgi:hypothetical protein
MKDDSSMNESTFPLHHLAHGRTGDKGNSSNISVIAWHPDLWDLLVEQVTVESVELRFRTRPPGKVRRYLLPRLHMMNFVLDDALDGGVNSALNLDSHGKSLSYILLDLPIRVPVNLVHQLVGVVTPSKTEN